ncbi:TetR/AcrR family transcriptional regulator C-terminal domain-containing protein [Streptomyces sp. 8L]|uniref:TetR/AcrR family transcriptional regulator C-terminal domain-containing protein n=1 Tax=Streptomyces sp. 8L TaxID=2877242 RepID=UPI001CD64FAF|nr:TetR/AcrR family transcriptional regulator C-terminal domain-containing protein [Streptomyces sp. 8L]MCA1218934.1 TetR/AcrR family transcriptional regulator C-terminal domain-containing protein [Streptomyces sp. 8L]
MTKKQSAARAPAGITLERVVAAAFDVLDRGGIAKLSTRAIAAELGVSMNTVMWHIRTKDRLLELMAEAIAGEVSLEGLRGEWHEQAAELLRRLRRAMLGHRDGGRIVAGTSPAEPHTLAFADRLVTVLGRGCPTPRAAAWTLWSLFYFVLGLVQEEQAAHTEWHDRLRVTVAERRLPALGAVLAEFTSDDFDGRFEFGIGQILRSAPEAQAPTS